MTAKPQEFARVVCEARDNWGRSYSRVMLDDVFVWDGDNETCLKKAKEINAAVAAHVQKAVEECINKHLNESKDVRRAVEEFRERAALTAELVGGFDMCAHQRSCRRVAEQIRALPTSADEK